MKDVIKKVPIPLCGVMLGAAALGNLLQSYSEGIRYVCGIFAAFLLILVLLKLIMFPGAVKEDMGNPIMASVSGTFPMALMILSTYVKPFKAAYYIWLLAIILHIMLIIYFTVKFVLKLQMPKVFASYYIVYVGIAVAAVTAPAYEQLGIGTAAFWFGFVTLIVLLVLVTYRYVKFNLNRIIMKTYKPNEIKNIALVGSAGSGKTADLYLRSTDQPVYCRLCTVRNTEIIRFPDGNVCSCNGYLYFCPGKSSGISEDAILPKLCSLHIPICYQCDRK